MTETVTSWQRFAELTIKTNDLDPMYSVIRALYHEKYERWLGRFILYFLMFYDAGGAYYAARDTTDATFWDYVKKVYPTAKRGTERRHFRGVAGLRAMANFGYRAPWEIIKEIHRDNYTELEDNIRRNWEGTQMGPYFIWKLFDIYNLIGMPVSLSLNEALRYMPDEPRKAAAHFFPEVSFKEALITVTHGISKYEHPVTHGYCGYAEAETVLCMMKGFFKTRAHRIGDDIEDKYKQLEGIPYLQDMLPPRIDMDLYQAGEPAWLTDTSPSAATA
jgi:hypothetical protein